MRSVSYLIWVFILSTVCPVAGQTGKGKVLTEADYALWSALNAEAISDYGHWVSYSLAYESGLDTLFVKHEKTGKLFSFPKGSRGKFKDEQYYGCMMPDHQLRLMDLTSGESKDYGNVQDYAYSGNGKYLLLFRGASSFQVTLEIIDFKGIMVLAVPDVHQYFLSNDNNSIAYISNMAGGGTAGIIEFAKQVNHKTMASEQGRHYENLVWQPSGNSIVFVSRASTAPAMTGDVLLYYRLANGKLFQYDTTIAKDWPNDFELAANYTNTLGIADDGKRVFFKLQRKPIAQNNDNDVQVWNALDKDLYSKRNRHGTTAYIPQMAAWNTSTGTLTLLATEEHPIVKLGPGQKYALVHHPDANKPSFKIRPDADYYLLDMETGLRKPFLMQQADDLSLSPNGKYIVYFRDGQWWEYEVATDKHTPITKAGDIAFCDFQNAKVVIPSGYATPLWTKNDQSVLLSDEYDVWEYNFATKSIKRITHGREQRIVYRVLEQRGGDQDSPVYNEPSYDTHAGLLLQGMSYNHSHYGYFLWQPSEGLRTLVYLPKRISGFQKAGLTDRYIYVREDYNEPPSLCAIALKGKPKIIIKSNKQHYRYNWGHSELIGYQNSKGEPLNGVLFYPFDYNPEQSYPMIVEIYEKQTRALHKYYNPTSSPQGFDVTYFTSRGYFVLLPDIVYEYGSPGRSALDCVVAAAKKAIATVSIDQKRLGLTGSSFGGYEASFIATQTDMFAAVVVGVGIYDFIGFCLDEDPSNNPGNYRFEHFQMRMKKPFFEDFDGYVTNSPLYHLAKLKTPILSFTGLKDYHVDVKQTYELYFGLRRLGKEHIMLLYPNEGHYMQQKGHRVDLVRKMAEWFGYYLKGEPRPDWMQAQ